MLTSALKQPRIKLSSGENFHLAEVFKPSLLIKVVIRNPGHTLESSRNFIKDTSDQVSPWKCNQIVLGWAWEWFWKLSRWFQCAAQLENPWSRGKNGRKLLEPGSVVHVSEVEGAVVVFDDLVKLVHSGKSSSQHGREWVEVALDKMIGAGNNNENGGVHVCCHLRGKNSYFSWNFYGIPS